MKSFAINNSDISLVSLILKTLATNIFSLKPIGFIFTLLPLGNSLLRRLTAISSSSTSLISTQNNLIGRSLFWSPTMMLLELTIWSISAEKVLIGLKTITEKIINENIIFFNFR